MIRMSKVNGEKRELLFEQPAPALLAASAFQQLDNIIRRHYYLTPLINSE